MAHTFELAASKRSDHGTSAARRMRRIQNSIPAVIYGGGKAPQSITLNHDHIVTASENEAFYSHILTIMVDGNAEKAVIKGMQRHPFKRKILHADFLRVRADEKITMNVPLHFKGEEASPGVKEGGAVQHHTTELQISCLPGNLPEFIDVDLSAMKVDQILHASELKLPKGVEVVTHGEDDTVLASIHMPRAAEAEESTPAPAAEAAAPAAEKDEKEKA